MVAYDGGKSVEKAIHWMASSPALQGLDCHLLHIGPNSSAAQKGMEAAAERLKSCAASVSIDNLVGVPENVIAEQVAERNIDILVMGAYGHSRIRSLLIGSTTTEMLRSCHIPVMLIR